MSTDVTKVGDFYNGGLWGKSLSFVGSSWNFVPGYIKNVDKHNVSFSSEKQVIKKLSPKSLWQTHMKYTVGIISQLRYLLDAIVVSYVKQLWFVWDAE